jgi:hypothetical protein
VQTHGEGIHEEIDLARNRHHALGVLRPNDYPCFVRMAYVGRIAMRQSAQLVLFVSLTFFTGAAHAVDRGQFENVPDDVRTWFKGVRSPAGVPCCDISDGHRTEYEVRAGAYWVPINGSWWRVPEKAIIRNAENPLGEAVVWYVSLRGNIEDPLLRPGRCRVSGVRTPFARNAV